MPMPIGFPMAPLTSAQPIVNPMAKPIAVPQPQRTCHAQSPSIRPLLLEAPIQVVNYLRALKVRAERCLHFV